VSALLLAAAAAVGLAAPHFSKGDSEHLVARYPTDALRERKSAAAFIDAIVDPTGRVISCKVLSAYGDQKLAANICRLIDGSKIEPAIAQGQPSYGVFRQLIRLFTPGNAAGDKVAALREQPEVEVQVNLLPQNKSNLRVTADVLVDPTGKPEACDVANAPAGYGDVACAQVAGVAFEPLQDKDGKPVQYVRSVIVDFVTGKPAD
jgi:hypothetical protein